MKKKFLKLLFTVLFTFIFIPLTNADVTGNECTIRITENDPSTWNTSWSSNLTICDMENAVPKGWDTESFDTVKAAFDYQNEWVYKTRESIDAKTIETVQVKRCDVPDAHIDANVTCTVETKGDPYWHYSDGTPMVNHRCPTGYPYLSNGYCYKNRKWESDTTTTTWSKDFTNIDSSFDALATCNQENDNNCTKCTSETYTLNCPLYGCDAKTEEVSTCTPTFTTGEKPAYCVNPSQGFAPFLSNGNNYMLDKTFDINKCFASSFNRADCGYANILIEGKYHNIDEQQIQLALRLWGVHTGGAGFDDKKVGVANVIGGSCSEYVTFVADDDVINIYKITHDYIWKYFFDKISKEEYVDASKANSYFDEVTCKNSQNSLVCGKLLNYAEAIALFFNTYNGNKYMQEHLYSIVGYDINTEPTNAIVETVEEKSRLELSFERNVNIQTEETFNCNDLEKDKDLPKEKRKYPNIDEPLRENILKYCNIEVLNFFVYDNDGNRIPIDVDKDSKEFDGYKGTIDFDIEKFAACKVNGQKKYTHYELEVEYLKTKTQTSVEKYIACSEPEENQYLFSFQGVSVTEEVPGESITKDEKDDKLFNISINCAGACTNYGIRENVSKCESQKEYNKYYTSTVKDPSLSCIINMGSNTNKNYYDYSNYFKVNTNLCRVYCSDEVNYHIAGKIDAVSGLQFKYDIKPGNLLNDSGKMFSSIIEEKRNCVSEIYYNNEFPNNPDWEGIYGITEEEINKYLKDDPKIRNWKDLFFVLFKKSQSEGYRSENLNQLVYDLYNCNFVKDISTFTNGNITRPKDNTIGDSYNYVNTLFNSKNNYGLVDSKNLDDMWLNTVSYEGGSEYMNSSSRVGNNNNDIDMKKEVKSQVSDVKYCTGFGYECLPYDSKNEKYTYDTFGNIELGSTGYEIDGKSTSIKNLKKILDTQIPVNDYAMFTITTQIGFYNSSEFEIEQYSGKVNKIIGSYNENYAKLDSFSYPLSKNAYNLCSKSSKDYASCGVTQTFSNASTFYRNRKTDDLSNALTKSTLTKFNCSVDVKIPEVTVEQSANSKTIYRDVDLSNLFPNGERDNTNWSTEYGTIAKNEIAESSSRITNDDYYLEYSFDLTPESIREIKNYNSRMEKNGGYLNNTLSNCTLTNDKYFNCESSFLRDIGSGNSLYVDNDSPNNKFDGISKYTKENK